MRRAWGLVQRYLAHDDPLVAATNLIALVVAWNQPFYPLYVWWAVSDRLWPTYFAFLSTPFFLAVPAVSRWSPRAGRAMLPLVGVGNTILCTKVFGEPSGTETFLIACALLPALFFRPDEWKTRLILVLLPFAVFYLLHGRYGAPAHVYSPSEYSDFLTLNALSAATLVVFTGYLAVSSWARPGQPD